MSGVKREEKKRPKKARVRLPVARPSQPHEPKTTYRREREKERRLKKAREEIKCFNEYEYVIINDVLERAVGDLCAIIAGERCRSIRLDSQVQEDLGI